MTLHMRQYFTNVACMILKAWMFGFEELPLTLGRSSVYL